MEDTKHLAIYRSKIDVLDEALVSLLCQRFQVAQDVAAVKRQQGIPVYLPERIQEVIQNVERIATEKGLPSGIARAVWTTIIEETCRYEDILLAQGSEKKT